MKDAGWERWREFTNDANNTIYQITIKLTDPQLRAILKVNYAQDLHFKAAAKGTLVEKEFTPVWLSGKSFAECRRASVNTTGACGIAWRASDSILGLRIENAHLAAARKLHLADDPRFVETNLAITGRSYYKVLGCPPGITMSEVATFLDGLGWKVIPQHPFRNNADSCAWKVAADADPPQDEIETAEGIITVAAWLEAKPKPAAKPKPKKQPASKGASKGEATQW